MVDYTFSPEDQDSYNQPTYNQDFLPPPTEHPKPQKAAPGSDSGSIGDLDEEEYEYNDDAESVDREIDARDLWVRKRKAYEKIRRMKLRNDIPVNPDLSMNSSLSDIEDELAALQGLARCEVYLSISKRVLVTLATLIEIISNKVDWIGLHLDGWSSCLESEMDSYDDILEELIEKYLSTKSGLAPELQLIFGIIMSAMSFQASHSVAFNGLFSGNGQPADSEPMTGPSEDILGYADVAA